MVTSLRLDCTTPVPPHDDDHVTMTSLFLLLPVWATGLPVSIIFDPRIFLLILMVCSVFPYP